MLTIGLAQPARFVFDPNGNLEVRDGVENQPPHIVRQPTDHVVQPGALSSFSVVVADTRGVAYQWRLNGSPLLGATNDSLLISPANQDEGAYSVVLVNGGGSVTSAPALLLIDGDRDGLPDSWEQNHFGGLGQRSDGDFDGDGVSNRDEYRDATNPADVASVLFRLTVISDGGHVTVSPSRFGFTNGEMVTLTATAFAPNTFHGWAGATNSLEPVISLKMDSNKTIFALLGSYNVAWTNNTGGNWNVASHWSPNVVPGSNDTVSIPRGVVVTLNSDAAVSSLVMGGAGSPTLAGAGTLLLHRNSSWSSGTMSGAGRTIVAPGATLTVANGSAVGLSRTLEIGGTLLWTGANINMNNAVITNRPGGLVEARGSGGLAYNGGTPRFDNAGTFRKAVHTGTTAFTSVGFNNFNVVEVQTGTLSLAGGGFNGGAIHIPAGSALVYASGTQASIAGSSITGGGNLTISGGTVNLAGLVDLRGTQSVNNGVANFTGNFICTNNTLNIAGGTANFSGTGIVSPAILNLGGGTLSGNQAVTVLGAMNWTGGSMSGSGRTVIPSGVTLTLANANAVALNRTLENGGTLSWTGANISMNNSVITNRPGALFETRGSGGLAFNGGSPRVDNAGTFRKTVHTGTTALTSVALNNYNTVELQTGTLSLSGGGLNAGTIHVPAGSALVYASGTHTAIAGSGIAGDGNLTINGGTVNLAGLVHLRGTHAVNNGVANFTGNVICTNNTLNIAGGTANFSGTGIVSPATLNLGGGTLSGNQAVTVLGAMNWTGGSMTGSGRTVIPSGVTLTLANANAVALNRTLENGGTLLWTGANISMNNSLITNRPGALFETRGGGGLAYNGGSPRVDNAGVFRKVLHAGTTAFTSVALNNFNVVELQTGTLSLNGGGFNSGSIEVPAGTALVFANGTHTSIAGSSIAGGGNLTIGGGTVNLAGLVDLRGTHSVNNGVANFTGHFICTNTTLNIAGGTANFSGAGIVSPATLNLGGGTLTGNQVVTVLGVMNWTGGSMSGSGRTVIPSGVTLNVANANVVGLNRRLENAGTMLWTGSTVSMNNSVITNWPGALIETRGSGGLAYNGGSPRFDNAGTFRKAVHTGTTALTSIPFNNYNVVEIRSGTLAPNGGFNSTTNSVLECVLAGLTPGVQHGRIQFTGPIALSGTLRVSFTNSFVPGVSDSFTVVAASSRQGSFQNFSYPSGEVTMIVSNTPNAVVVRVLDVLTGAARPLLTASRSGTNLLLHWTAEPNATYRLEYSDALEGGPWNVLAGDVTALTNFAQKVEILGPTNRLYRLRVLP
ncbi:MAG TPA: hypothetical protein VEH04_17915 [Verrucomicrobiae bacterium]|nr:hypothetical protein [Verrucomicrobiae bacterium]